jgi:hypothetical protein
MAECIVIGALYAEAACISSWDETASSGGKAARFSDRRREQMESRERLLEEAREWRERKPHWKASQVARRLPGNQDTVRKAIAPLWKRTEK